MEKLKMHSPNLTDENIAKIRELFPACVTEVKGEDGKPRYAVDFDQLKQELSDHIVEGPQERYHLNWPGKREALLAANAPIAKTLRPARDESVDFDTTKNLFIEGDNLEALKLLQETYLGKIKLIYIDPPYNTGKDFVYSDAFAEEASEYLISSGQSEENGSKLVANPESNGRYHSAWLSMIYPRIKLARNLLRDDGIICVSIDENEISNLKLLMNEVYGAKNCLGVIANVNNPKGRSDDKFIATAHEYIVVFAKDAGAAKVWGFEPEEKIIKRYNKTTEDGQRFRDMDLRKTGDEDRRADRPDMFYYFYYSEQTNSLRVSKEQSGNPDEIEIVPLRDDGTEGRWRWGFDTAKREIESLYARFMPNRQIWGVFEIDLLDGRDAVKSTSTWTFKDVNSERGSEEFVALGFDKEVFQRPKPIGTLKRIIEVGTTPTEEAILLDFFAGSGGFGQAALELCADGKRKLNWILVQLDESCAKDSMAYRSGFKSIPEIAKERLRRASAKILAAEYNSNWNRDIGFRALKIADSNMADVYYTPDAVKQGDLLSAVENIKPGRDNPEDLLFQVLVDWGVDLTLPIRKEVVQGKTVFFVNDAPYDLIACFDKGVSEDLVKEIAKHEPMRVVFRDNGFESDAVKINVDQIFRQLSPSTDVKSI
jgi:adenine-specific DNA-methyltransferase